MTEPKKYAGIEPLGVLDVLPLGVDNIFEAMKLSKTEISQAGIEVNPAGVVRLMFALADGRRADVVLAGPVWRDLVRQASTYE